MVRLCLIGILLIALISPAWAQEPDYTIRIEVTAPKNGEWKEIRSRSFLVIGNAGEKQLRRITVDLEELRRQFIAVFPYAEFRSPAGLTVVAFRNNRSFQPFQSLGGETIPNEAGYVRRGGDVNYIVLNAEEKNRRSVYRAYIEGLIHESPLPAWLRTGLAEYYSTFTDERYLIGESRIAQVGMPVPGYDKLLRDRNFIPFPKLFDLDESSLGRDERDVYRAESWSLVHMLHNPQEVDLFKRFLALLASGSSQEESLANVFSMDAPSLESALRRYIKESKSNGWAYTQTPYCMCTSSPGDWMQFNSDGLQADIKGRGVQDLTAGELQFHIGDLLLHSGKVREAQAYLEEALRSLPDLAGPHISLAALKVGQNRFSEAAELLTRALTLDPLNPLGQYYSAVLIRQQRLAAESALSQENLESMQAALTTALRMAPHFNDARTMLTEVNLLLGRADLNAALEATVAEVQVPESDELRAARRNRWLVSVDQLEAQSQGKGKNGKQK
jgi:tetratricopeptide (TPR) repeat protein